DERAGEGERALRCTGDGCAERAARRVAPLRFVGEEMGECAGGRAEEHPAEGGERRQSNATGAAGENGEGEEREGGAPGGDSDGVETPPVDGVADGADPVGDRLACFPRSAVGGVEGEDGQRDHGGDRKERDDSEPAPAGGRLLLRRRPSGGGC